MVSEAVGSELVLLTAALLAESVGSPMIAVDELSSATVVLERSVLVVELAELAELARDVLLADEVGEDEVAVELVPREVDADDVEEATEDEDDEPLDDPADQLDEAKSAL